MPLNQQAEKEVTEQARVSDAEHEGKIEPLQYEEYSAWLINNLLSNVLSMAVFLFMDSAQMWPLQRGLLWPPVI